jgi:hypothetical protein
MLFRKFVGPLRELQTTHKRTVWTEFLHLRRVK